MAADLLRGEPRALTRRGLSMKTCEKFGYWIGEDSKGESVQIANYRHDGQVAAQKIRTRDKNFWIAGDASEMGLFGQHLWRDAGKRVVITEGEIDAMSLAQVFGLSWPVVSLPRGAADAKRAVSEALEWLEAYDDVVLMFDMDVAGRTAASECAPLFSPGKCRIAELPLKDANEMLVADRAKELTTAVYEARTYRPGGIVNGADLWEAMESRNQPGLEYPFPELTKMTMGQHMGTLVMWTSGTGMGKSTAVAEVAYDLLMRHGLRVGYVALEESVGRTAQRFVGLHMNKPIHLDGYEGTAEERRAAFDEVMGTGRFWTYDHFGSMEEDSLFSKLRYLAKGCGCDVIIIDHLSIVVSGLDDNSDERKLIDRVMTKLRSLVEETGILMHVVSHLKRADGDKGHEEGARVTLAQLRGSHSIAQLSDDVIAFERDQQSADEADISTTRVLKCRLTGNTGIAGRNKYDKATGRMFPYVQSHFAADEHTDY